jgi:hypothetical protein
MSASALVAAIAGVDVIVIDPRRLAKISNDIQCRNTSDASQRIQQDAGCQPSAGRFSKLRSSDTAGARLGLHQ